MFLRDVHLLTEDESVIKYTYTVIRAFVLSGQEDCKCPIICSPTTKNSGTRFEQGVKYVDYKFPTKDLDPAEITQILVEEGYIELLKEETFEIEED